MTGSKPPVDRGAPPKKSKKRLGSIVPRAHCYVGLSVPVAVANGVADLQRKLATHCDEHFVIRWVPATIAHLTLRYLGRYDPAVLEAVEDALRRELAVLSPVRISCRGLRLTPDAEEPEFIWLGCETDQTYNMLCQRLDLALAELGFEPQAAPELHLTLGIVCSGRPSEGFLAELASLSSTTLRCVLDDVTLFTSSWSDGEPRFEIRRRARLAGIAARVAGAEGEAHRADDEPLPQATEADEEPAVDDGSDDDPSKDENRDEPEGGSVAPSSSSQPGSDSQISAR